MLAMQKNICYHLYNLVFIAKQTTPNGHLREIPPSKELQ